jgi:hypothetical protein
MIAEVGMSLSYLDVACSIDGETCIIIGALSKAQMWVGWNRHCFGDNPYTAASIATLRCDGGPKCSRYLDLIACSERIKCHDRPPFKVQSGLLGVLALPDGLMRSTMADILRVAQEFAAEWIELRAVVRSKLFSRCLSLPLQV